MATIPEPSILAQEILSIFVNHFKSRPGGTLRINSFLATWPKTGNRMADLATGAEFAIEKGWLEEAEGGSGFRITMAGYSEAGGTLPSAEDSARGILSIFVNDRNCRPGETLRLSTFQSCWHKLGYIADEFSAGRDYAAELGWIEILENGGSYRLTEAGFKAA